MKSKITHAAVKTECGLIMLGKCHADCFHKAHHTGLKASKKALDQGFMTNKGKYVDRMKAAKIAKAQKQILSRTTVLCSEDLWSPRDNGLYNYDYVLGYILK
jgi:lactam utilization protein B